MGRKMILLLGWLTRGVRFRSGCGSGASRRGEAVLAGRWDPAVGVCVRAGGEAKLGRLCGPRARVGGQAGSAGLARKAEQAWAAAAPSLLFPSLFLFLFVLCIYVTLLSCI